VLDWTNSYYLIFEFAWWRQSKNNWSAWETVHGRKTVADSDDSGRMKCIRGTCIIHEFSTSGDQHNVNIPSGSKKTTKEERELTLQQFHKAFRFGMNFLVIKTSIVWESCWKGWKSTWAWQKREPSLMDVFWVKHFRSLSLHGRIDHRWSVGWSMPILTL